jgi:hypothetical protein
MSRPKSTLRSLDGFDGGSAVMKQTNWDINI